MIEYRKTRTRARYLLRQEICYIAERKLLPKLCNDKTYYEPLFVYTPDKGTDIFYDFTTLEQDPSFAAEYFKDNPQEFDKIMKEFLLEKERLVLLLKEKRDFEAIIELLGKFWAKIALFIALGDLKDEIVGESIAGISYKSRVENDRLIYEAVDILLDLSRQRVPLEFKEFVDFLLIGEIISMNLPSLDEIEKRRKGYIYFKGDLHINKKIEDIMNVNELFIKDLELSNEIKGLVACRGFVKGFARIIFEASKLENLQNDEIIVAPMTTPDFIPFLGKVSAIVTEEGGMTSHAAIIAREFNIPTIVGTQNATKLLKDGDLIEVDANLGIVRKINQ